MKIESIKSFINSYNFIGKNKSNSINFRQSLVVGDCFQHSNPHLYKIAKIKNLEGQTIYATISREEPELSRGGDAKKFIISVNNNQLGSAIVLSYPKRYKGIFLSDLYTEDNKSRHYKGAGTELLKCAVEESKKRGYEGVVTCCAYYDHESPFVFYYKNNFEVYDGSDQHMLDAHLFNAVLQYAAKNNIAVSSLLPKDHILFYMRLNEKGADMLTQGKRLYEDRKCDEVANIEIDGEIHSAQFIESPNEGEYFIQVLNESKDSDKLCFIAALGVVQDIDGNKHFEFKEVKNDFLYSYQEVDDFALGLIDDLEKKYL